MNSSTLMILRAIGLPPVVRLPVPHSPVAPLPVAQLPNTTPVATPEATSVLFSGPQFFIALVSGILLAFAIQLLLTNFSVAAGISLLGKSGSRRDDRHGNDRHGNDRYSNDRYSNDRHNEDAAEGDLTIRKISFGVGIWTLITVSLALFFACYMAVQLSLLTSPRLGAIISLVIWAAYFSLLVWVSSTTVGSLIGSVVQAATSGFQAILGTATAAIGGQAAKHQMVSTAEAVVAAVRNELGSAIDPASLSHSVERYLSNLRLPGLDFNRVQADLESLLNDPTLAELADSGRLAAIDRRTFADLVSQRTDLSRQEASRLVDLLEAVWSKAAGRRQPSDHLGELVEYLRSTQPGQLQIDELNAKVDRLLAERQSRGMQTADVGQTMGLQSTLQSGLNTAIGLLVGRTDLSDLNLSQIMDRLKSVSSSVTDQAKSLTQSTPAYNPIENDVEQYLLNTYSWQMDRATLSRDFRHVLYDPDANAEAILAGLSRLNRDRFVQLLASRGVFTQSRIQEIADQLEAIRLEVMAAVQAEREREIAADLRQRIEIYLTLTPKEQLMTTETLPAFEAILRDEEADYEGLAHRLAAYDRLALERILMQRADLNIEEQRVILAGLERTREQVLFNAQSMNEQAKQRYREFQGKLETYLSNTGKSELNPEAIKRDLHQLAHDPATGLSALRHRAAQFDRDTWVKLLSQRPDLTEAEVNQVIDQVEANWNQLIHAPENAVAAAKDQYDQTLAQIADYLRRTNLEELNPEGIQRDLQRLLRDPRSGMIALRRRLSKIDRQTLVQLLSQRPDLSEAQVNQTIDQVLGSIQQIVRTPRRLALRTQQQAINFETGLEEYLRNTEKEELNPEGIKRDLRLLVESPRLGLQNLGDRLSHLDRSTLVALLAQRPDISPAEAERIVQDIESIRDQMLDQLHRVQARFQSLIDGILDRIRTYLNSLDRPELNYDGIKQDIRQLFDDPQAGFEALRTRLSHFDRQTLIALLSSRDDISEADANRILDQIEGARTSVLQRAEQIQAEAQRRLEAIKLQTQRQLDETRKAASIAAWWLFATALLSAIAAAGGGILASS
ncbi:MAG: MFS transporter [Elainella sp. Prado103]|nr:MFS transporter [Elainella sp. Prado103]